MAKLVLVEAAHYWLQLGPWQHELHLLGQHGGCCLLLDQVVPAVDLQLRLEVRRGVQIFTVVTRAAALQNGGRREKKVVERKRERRVGFGFTVGQAE